MKYLSKYVFLLVAFSGFGQVGIGTTAPEAALHIAGENSTIRLEGLSHNNNSASNDGINLAPVLVDLNGTAVLNPISVGSPHNFITDASTVFASTQTVIVNSGTQTTTSNIYNYNITLTRSAYIEVKYGLEFNVYETTGVNINDGKVRQIKNYFTIDGGSDKYGQISQNYYNIDSDGANAGFSNRGTTYIRLDPGTHTINFWAQVNQGLTNSTEVIFGGDNSSLKIRTF